MGPKSKPIRKISYDFKKMPRFKWKMVSLFQIPCFCSFFILIFPRQKNKNKNLSFILFLSCEFFNSTMESVSMNHVISAVCCNFPARYPTAYLRRIGTRLQQFRLVVYSKKWDFQGTPEENTSICFVFFSSFFFFFMIVVLFIWSFP